MSENKGFYSDKGSNANVVTMWEFALPSNTNKFSNFVKYTNRNEAIKRDDYSDYVGYTSRDSARVIDFDEENSDSYTTCFNGSTTHMTVDDVAALEAQLNLAQDHGSPLQKGVISFKTDWLVDNGIVSFDDGDVTNFKNGNRHVFQNKLKLAVQNALEEKGGLLDMEKFNSPIWWGNVHLNTDDVHVHIGICESGKSKRDLTNEGETKGEFRQHSIDHFKRAIYDYVSQNNRLVELERTENELSKDIQKRHVMQVNLKNDYLLNRAFKALPKNKKVWREKSNSKQIAASKKLVHEYIENVLKDDPLFQDFIGTLESYNATYRANFGDIRVDQVERGTKELKADLSSAIFARFRDMDSGDFEKDIKEEFENSSDKENEEAINSLKDQLKRTSDSTLQRKLKQEIGLRKMAIRKHHIDDLKSIADERYSNVLGLEKQASVKFHNSGKELLSFKKNQYRMQSRFYELSLKATYQMSQDERDEKKLLEVYGIDVVNINPDKLSAKSEGNLVHMLDRESRLISKVSEEEFKEFGDIYGLQPSVLGRRNQINELHRLRQITEYKGQVRDKNILLKNMDKDSLNAKRIRGEIGGIFNNLKVLYAGGAATDVERERVLVVANYSNTRHRKELRAERNNNGLRLSGSFLSSVRTFIALASKERQVAILKRPISFDSDFDSDEIELQLEERKREQDMKQTNLNI
ncbi:hypothetical protein EQG49_13295 [Periweissella cryptocerci]|uniref:Relaxase n=1 Tax=Periweissella cryptocerci TaxID=2506420 RepID=A0A4P6YWX3_9LACO|nr:relaxase MobL [Periweissella cryptocerci]QBO37372.1 hypothetical protein EQG49_13295 [Periweissella cryptocerci]